MMPEQRSTFIISVQRARTTSLFEYVHCHPEVYMPPQKEIGLKEIGFFSSDFDYARGNEWYSVFATGDAPPAAVCREASVSYMSGTTDQRRCGGPATASLRDLSRYGRRRDEVIPRRIRECAPDVKLICVLRDPVARCLSHYRMAVLAGSERRTFEQAAEYLLQPDALEHARSTLTGTGYIVLGEYFRILSALLADVPGRAADGGVRVRLGLTPRRRRGPVVSLHRGQRRLYTSEPGHKVSPSRGRAPRGRSRSVLLAGASAGDACPHTLASPASPDALANRSATTAPASGSSCGTRRGGLDDAIPTHVRNRLISHFRPDSEALQSTLGVEVPWLADWT